MRLSPTNPQHYRSIPGIGLFACALTLLSGCDLFEPEACETIELPGITVHVLDAESGTPIPDGLSATAEDGDYFEEMIAGTGSLSGAFERPGVYNVFVTAEGYESVTIEDVRVEAGSCHVRTREISVSLDPA